MSKHSAQAPGIEGIITLADGTQSAFTIDARLYAEQWGADAVRLGRTRLVLDRLSAALEDRNPFAEV